VPDEAITLTAALQYAGYQEVIGRHLWSVSDRSAARITQSVYRELILDGQLWPLESARVYCTTLSVKNVPDIPITQAVGCPFLYVGV
jgi:hypothetical protein